MQDLNHKVPSTRTQWSQKGVEEDIGIFCLENSFTELFWVYCCIYLTKSNVGYILPTKHLIFLFVFIHSVL